jgi:hypothetical protein
LFLEFQDNTVRIWDLNTKKGCKICIPDKSLFGSKQSSNSEGENLDCNEISVVSFIDEFLLLVAIGPSLIAFNLNTTDVIIQKSIFQIDLQAGDINSIRIYSITDKPSVSSLILTVCDDAVIGLDVKQDSSGVISILDKRFIVTKMHSAFVSCATLVNDVIADDKPMEVVSGGFDCKIVCSSTDSNCKPNLSFDLNSQETVMESGNVKQMFNPPYVHSLTMSSNRNWLIASTGNGSIEMIHLKHRMRADPFEAHSSSANFVCFSNFSLSQPGSSPSSILISAGNDLTLAFRSFDVPQESEVGKYAELRERQLDLQARIKAAKKTSKPQAKLMTSFTAQLSQINGVPTSESLLKVQLANCANWIATSSTVTPAGNVFIADTSDSITCFTISASS